MSSGPTSDVDLTRLANLRDVASADPTALRAGVLYRSAAPQPGDAAPQASGWPPRTVIDLRSPGERAPGAHPLAAPETSVVDIPMAAALAPNAQARSRDITIPMSTRYLDALEVASWWLPALVGTAARAEAPVLVHCAAGKDRTGVAVGLLLALVGVRRDAVEQDYARTADALLLVHARLDLAGERDGRAVARHSDVVPEAISAVLDQIGPDATAVALAHGVPAIDVGAWLDRIRVTAPAG